MRSIWLKPRESRKIVMLAARLRHSEAWVDASILNISSGGLQLHATSPPSRGTYIEVRRGTHVIIGRVVWVKADRFGMCAQDKLAINALIANAPPSKPASNDQGGTAVERRVRPRSEALEWRYAQSQGKGRSLQFACIAGFGLILAASVYEAVRDTFSKPLSIASMQLIETH